MEIYLALNFPATKRELKKKFLDYNNMVAEENRNLVEGKKKRKLARSGEWDVLITLMEFYSAHLYNNQKLKSQHDFRTFRANNVAIAGKTGPNGISSRTVKRHLLTLIQMNIITKKIWHGSNSSFELFFNPKFLIAKNDLNFTNVLKQKYLEATGKKKISDTELKEILKHSPSFESNPSGILKWPTCPHIPTGAFDNNNNGIQIVNIIDELKLLMASQPHEIIHNSLLKKYGMHERCESHDKSLDFTKSEKLDFPAAKISVSQELIKTRTNYVYWAWRAAKTILYKDSHINNEQRISIAKKHLNLYFSDHQGNPLTNFEKYYNDFIEIIINQRNTIRKASYRFVPPADIYFDPSFKTKDGKPAGFYAAKLWFENVIIPNRKKNSDYYANNRLLSDSFQSYCHDKSLPNYLKLKQVLEKKKDTSLLDDFNHFVLSSNQDKSREYFTKRWERHVEHKIKK